MAEAWECLSSGSTQLGSAIEVTQGRDWYTNGGTLNEGPVTRLWQLNQVVDLVYVEGWSQCYGAPKDERNIFFTKRCVLVLYTEMTVTECLTLHVLFRPNDSDSVSSMSHGK